jgi:hypothetical protein
MGWLVFALALAIPAIVGGGQLRLVSPEYGVAFIWIAVALAAAIGTIDRMQQSRKPERVHLSRTQTHLVAQAS